MDVNNHHGLTNRDRVLTSLCAGAFAGALAKTAIAPLDRTKIYFQTTPSAAFSTRSVLRYLKQSYKTDGLLTLWRGNSATMARIIPYAAIQFTAHEQWKRLLRVEESKDTNLLRFLSGSLAGITAQSLTYPLDMTRARLAISHKDKYKSLVDTVVKVYTQEGGIRTLYRGYIATMMGVIPYAGFSFYTYDLLKRKYKEYSHEESGALCKLLFGAVAGVFGQSCSYPFDIVRRRLQVHNSMQGGVFSIMVSIARTEGIIGGLYKGLSMNWIKGPVAAGISFSVFDLTQNFLRSQIIHKS